MLKNIFKFLNEIKAKAENAFSALKNFFSDFWSKIKEVYAAESTWIFSILAVLIFVFSVLYFTFPPFRLFVDIAFKNIINPTQQHKKGPIWSLEDFTFTYDLEIDTETYGEFLRASDLTRYKKELTSIEQQYLHPGGWMNIFSSSNLELWIVRYLPKWIWASDKRLSSLSIVDSELERAVSNMRLKYEWCCKIYDFQKKKKSVVDEKRNKRK